MVSSQIAEYRVAHLNRQFISILAALGVEEGIFEALFREAVEHIRGLPLRVASSKASKKDLRDASSLAFVSGR
jgi:hypothetical protein